MRVVEALSFAWISSIMWGIACLSPTVAVAVIEDLQDSNFQRITPVSHLYSDVSVEPLPIPQAVVKTTDRSIAVEPSDTFSESGELSDVMVRVNSVEQLADVQPNDWAFQALQSLVERHGCIAGDSGNLYRSNQALSRYEFAAELNACLDRISELTATGTVRLATRENLSLLQKLQEEFATELSILRGRVNTLESRTAQLEANQFSTTTKLSGEIIFGLTGVFGDQKAATVDSHRQEPLDESIIFSGRTRFRLNTSFTGEDLLRIRLQATDTPNLADVTGTSLARLGFDGGSVDDRLTINQLYYRFPIGPSARATVIASGALFDVVDTLNPLLGNDATGSPFLFGVRSPIYREEIGGSGAGISYDLSPALNLSLVYLASDADQPSLGLFHGPYSALGQLTWRPSSSAAVGLVYSRSYNGIQINAGSANANRPFGDASQNITANSYGLVGNVRISPNFALGGWIGFVQATAKDLPDNPTVDIFYYALTLAFPDVGREGNLGGVILGQPPRVIRNQFGVKDPDISFNVEVFYRFQVNDNISIAPGLLIIINPEHNRTNDPLYVGTIRTTFSF